MAKLSLLAGTTSKTVKVFIQSNLVSTGAGLTGLAYNTSGLTAYYIQEGQSSTTQINLVSSTLGTYTSSGFIVVDATNMPGVYELGIPNAALTGAKSVIIYLQGAANMVPTILEIELTAVDNQSVTYGLTTTGWTISSVSGSVGSVAGNVGGNVTGSVGSVAGSVNSVTSAVTISGTSALTESYAAAGSAVTLAQALYMILQILSTQSITGTTLTIYGRNGSTPEKTYTLNSATAPTSITETT